MKNKEQDQLSRHDSNEESIVLPKKETNSSIVQLKESARALGCIDQKYEKEKYMMKEIIIIEYMISLLDFFKKNPKLYYQTNSSQLILLFTQNKYHIQNEINDEVRSFITSFLFSYQKQLHKSQELEFLNRYLEDDIKHPLAVISFHIKLRKNIISNFIDNHKNGLLEVHQIKFDDWSTLVTRFLGSSNIPVIGKIIKSVNTQTNQQQKIFNNSIDACTLIQICTAQFEKHLPQSNQSTVVERVESPIKTETLMEPEEQEKKIQLQSMSPTSTNGNPQKLISQLQEQKYKLLDEKLKQNIGFTKALKLHESLADSYWNLAQQTKSMQQVLSQVALKVQRGQQFNENDLKKIEEMLRFKDIMEQDPREQLKKSGVYEFLPQS